MTDKPCDAPVVTAQDANLEDDVQTLHALGYAQELLRRMSGFSNYAISLSIICILAGGITSFHLGFCSVGGASIGLGWPLVALMSLAFAATMAQLASAFPTAGGLYHWASILGGRGWGWATAWLNLAGLVTVLAAINVGTYQFLAAALMPRLGIDVNALGLSGQAWLQFAAVTVITLSQALVNHRGIKATTRLTDFSGYLILVVALMLTIALLCYAPSIEPSRLVTFTNYSGSAGSDVWPAGNSLAWLFALSFLLPAYTITGFDASAHTSEETVGAAREVPRAIVRAVLVSGIFGWIMLMAVVLAMPDMDSAAAQGSNVFYWTIDEVLPNWLAAALYLGIGSAQYLCGLATVTSASRMAYAFARDGGLPLSLYLRQVSVRFRSPAIAIWSVSILSVAFTVYTPVYSTITTVCVILLYASYVIPTTIGLFTFGRTWTRMGPWNLGRGFAPLALLCIVWCGVLIVVGVQPPNDKALWILLALIAALAIFWFAQQRHSFMGPPNCLIRQDDRDEIPRGAKSIQKTPDISAKITSDR
ncbi:MAG: amino acid permease [Pirellulales bacterium]